MDQFTTPGYVSTLLVYNASIFTAYTNGRITSVPLPTNWFKPSVKSSSYSFDIISDEKDINDMIGYKGSLFVTTSNQLQCFNIKKSPVEKNQYYTKNIVDCTHMRINYRNNLAFAISEERGIVVLNVSNPLNPRYIGDIDVNLFYQEDCIITGIDIHENTIFLALRNKGILRLDYYQNEIQEPKIYRSFEKISLKDPQDVKFNKKNSNLYIADADEGLIILSTMDNKIIHCCRLPNDDFPRKLIIHNNNCIVQGSKGLYLYNTREKDLEIILNFKIGAIAKYYNKIFFYKNKKLNLLVFGNSVEMLDNDVFTSVYQYTNNNVFKIK
ncbi:hypothetical protein CN993_00785 [Bacillus thuringiensis]|uniref:hypothetical protein n=1 Tax=Bacillus thuringiensis TaxID=1428 RepID=UPI000BFC4343|nr:hypothetical protein [Bacillus thuringiensis]PGP49038.1 hypothetical protein CN993_00785 [Bacillus thuringiensis]